MEDGWVEKQVPPGQVTLIRVASGQVEGCLDF